MLKYKSDSIKRKSPSTPRRSKRIVMVPRKPISYSEKKYSLETVFESLNTPPNERTTWQIDSLTMYFMNSPEFLKIAKNKREIRNISKNVELEFHNPNSILFSTNDPFDGIYYIYKGQIALVVEKKKEIQNSSPVLIKSPSGINKSGRQKIFKEEVKSDQNLQRNNYSNYISTTSSESNESISNLHLSTYQRTEIQPPLYSIPLMTENLLECRFGFGKKFDVIELKKTNSIIGADSNEVKRQKKWLFTAIVTEPTYIVRIESSLYRKTIECLRTEEQLKIANFLEEIIEFDPILDRPEIFERLSQDMRTITVPKGTKRSFNRLFESESGLPDVSSDEASLENCWFVIKSGSVGRYREVNFNHITIDHRALFVDSIEIKIPKGKKLIKTETYGPKHCLADSSLSAALNRPYELKFLEDTVIHVISYNDVKAIIPFTLRKQIEKLLLDDPSEDELIRGWCESEMAVQWQIFKHKISKEAKLFTLHEKIMMTGEVTCRRPSPPKQIKDHQKALKNPRFHAKREIEKIKEQKKIEWAPSFRLLMKNNV